MRQEGVGLSMLRNVTNIPFSNKALRDNKGSRLIFVTFLHHQGAVSELLGFLTKNPQSYCKTIAYRTCLWKTWVYLWKSLKHFVERMGNQWGESTGKIRIAKKSEVRLLAPRIRVNTKNAPHPSISPSPPPLLFSNSALSLSSHLSLLSTQQRLQSLLHLTRRCCRCSKLADYDACGQISQHSCLPERSSGCQAQC